MYNDAINLYGWAMSESLRYDEFEMWKGQPDCYLHKLEDILNTPDNSDIGYFVEIDLSYPDNINEKTKNFHFAHENKDEIPMISHHETMK